MDSQFVDLVDLVVLRKMSIHKPRFQAETSELGCEKGFDVGYFSHFDLKYLGSKVVFDPKEKTRVDFFHE